MFTEYIGFSLEVAQSHRQEFEAARGFLSASPRELIQAATANPRPHISNERNDDAK